MSKDGDDLSANTDNYLKKKQGKFMNKYKSREEFIDHFVNKLPCIKDCLKKKMYNQHPSDERVSS